MTDTDSLLKNLLVKEKNLKDIVILHEKIDAMCADAYKQHQSAFNAYQIYQIKQNSCPSNCIFIESTEKIPPLSIKSENIKCPHCLTEWNAVYPDICNQLQCPHCKYWIKLYDDILYKD